jgi:hypothetical protein
VHLVGHAVEADGIGRFCCRSRCRLGGCAAPLDRDAVSQHLRYAMHRPDKVVGTSMTRDLNGSCDQNRKIKSDAPIVMYRSRTCSTERFRRHPLTKP